jgi:hypothetical protein
MTELLAKGNTFE